MRILTLGAGVIGTTYGLLSSEAGQDVRHVVRPAEVAPFPRSVAAQLLDGRRRPPC